MQEILYRDDPFHNLDLEPQSIIERIKKVQTPPFRPLTIRAPDDPEAITYLPIMKRCWEEMPLNRPTFSLLRFMFSGQMEDDK